MKTSLISSIGGDGYNYGNEYLGGAFAGSSGYFIGESIENDMSFSHHLLHFDIDVTVNGASSAVRIYFEASFDGGTTWQNALVRIQEANASTTGTYFIVTTGVAHVKALLTLSNYTVRNECYPFPLFRWSIREYGAGIAGTFKVYIFGGNE